MQITPAILTSDINIFSKLIKEFEFTQTVDIDISRPPFVENTTLQLIDIMNLIDFDHYSIGFHFMVNDPIRDLEFLMNSNAKEKALRIYLHQESELEFLNYFEWPQNWIKCVAVKLDSPLMTLEFYRQFEEVQLMSIETGRQGNPFKEEVLDRVEALTRLGYFGKISLDGGINLDTVDKVKNSSVDRLSVGSYLQKSQNVRESYRMLEEVLESKF